MKYERNKDKLSINSAKERKKEGTMERKGTKHAAHFVLCKSLCTSRNQNSLMYKDDIRGKTYEVTRTIKNFFLYILRCSVQRCIFK